MIEHYVDLTDPEMKLVIIVSHVGCTQVDTVSRVHFQTLIMCFLQVREIGNMHV